MRFEGSIVAVVTPWTPEQTLDVPALQRLIDFQVAAGSSALVIGGSTGESASLEEAELYALWQHALAAAAGRIALIAGTGSPSTARSLRWTRMAASLGMAAALVVTPAYVRPTQAGLLAHYLALAEAGLPVLLYNVPGRTACDLLPDTVAQLAAHEHIVGIKEAVADPARIAALAELRSARFCVLSGDDPSALQALRAGFDGVVSVAANAVPAPFAALVAAARRGDFELAGQLDARLQPLYAALALEPNPIPVKHAMARLGLCAANLRLPLQPLSPAYHSRVDTALALAARADHS